MSLTRNNTQERGNRNKIKKGTRLREREKEGVTSFFFSLGLAYFEEIKGWALIGPFGIHLSLSPSSPNGSMQSISFFSFRHYLFIFLHPFWKTAVNGCVCVCLSKFAYGGSLDVGQAQKETEEAGQAPAMEPDITNANMGINKYERWISLLPPAAPPPLLLSSCTCSVFSPTHISSSMTVSMAPWKTSVTPSGEHFCRVRTAQSVWFLSNLY